MLCQLVYAVLELVEPEGGQARHAGGDRTPLAAQAAGAGQDGGAVEDVERYGDHAAVLGAFEGRAAGPLVEGGHRRAAPDLVVDGPRRLPGVGPVRREAEVPAEDQRHLVLGVAPGQLDLRRVAAFEEGAGLLPDRLE